MGSSALRIHRNAVDAGELRPLQPWEMLLAEYIVQTRTRNVNYEKLHTFLATFDHAPQLDDKALRKLIYRDKSFKRYRDLYENDILSAMRQRILTHVPEFVTAHVKGLQLAVASENPKDIALYTQPMIDRALPKREEHTPTIAVQIVLNARQLAAFDTPAIEVEHDVLEAEVEV